MNKPPKDPGRNQPEHADEKTQRRIAESQHGGISSEESSRRYEIGDHPGGTHQGGRPARPGPNGHGSSSGEDGGF
ncbi:hypothetical protein [Polyangium sp. y55x31]|uniref:hypothetical protein n=1 Tax=Polyangium sp. y55x31 TaxID=3042688 RepID=UPI0024831C17|nr:hypothetical protein [Polyangium sp. y55x31]MDI1484523.1 hypothetical protein [Polyangium sp. y55x31]